MPHIKKASDQQLLDSYAELKNLRAVAKVYGMCGQSVHERLTKLNAIDSDRWTPDEDQVLIQLYGQYDEPLFLQSIAKSLGRTKASIACRANELGITNNSRKNTKEHNLATGRGLKAHIAKNGHNKGMLGKKHPESALQQISESVKKRMAEMTPEMFALRGDKTTATKILRGNVNPNKTMSNPHSRTVSGKRQDLGNQFFRSRAEANYARYLNFIGHEWEYEPKDFYFEKIRRGCVSYTPDFYNKTTDQWIEVKGWFEDKAKTKINRFKKYFPDEFKKMVMVTQSKKTMREVEEMGIPFERYETIAKQVSKLIPTWE